MDIRKFISGPDFYPTVSIVGIVGMVGTAKMFSQGLENTVSCVKAHAPIKRIFKEASRMLVFLGFASLSVGAIVLQQRRIRGALNTAADAIARLTTMAAPAAGTVENAIVQKAIDEPKEKEPEAVPMPGSHEDILMVETVTGQEFVASIDYVDRAVNEFNRDLISDGEATYDEFLDLLPFKSNSLIARYLKYEYTGFKSDLLMARYKSQVEGNRVKVYVHLSRLPEC